MQHILDFEFDGKKYVSKPFDFETMCIVNDAHNSMKQRGPLNICRNAVDYMFEGTDATQDVIDGLDVSVRTKLCLKVWELYCEAVPEKNA